MRKIILSRITRKWRQISSRSHLKVINSKCKETRYRFNSPVYRLKVTRSATKRMRMSFRWKKKTMKKKKRSKSNFERLRIV